MLKRARASLRRHLGERGLGAPVVLGVALCLGVAAGAALVAPRTDRRSPQPSPLQAFLAFAWRPLLVTLAVAGVRAMGARGDGGEPPGLWTAIQAHLPWREARPRGVTIH